MTSEQLDLSKLRELLTKRFDLEELRSLVFDLGIDYDSLRGEGQAAKARELVAYLERRDRVLDLVELGQKLRSDVPWHKVTQTSKEKPDEVSCASRVSANVNNVDNSTVIISGRDVKVNALSSPENNDKDFRLSKYFCPRDDNSGKEEPLSWRPQVNLSMIDEEQDMRYLDTLVSQSLASPEECAAWRRQLAELEINLLLVEERLSQFVMDTDPANLQLVKQKRKLEKQIAELKGCLAARCPEK